MHGGNEAGANQKRTDVIKVDEVRPLGTPDGENAPRRPFHAPKSGVQSLSAVKWRANLTTPSQLSERIAIIHVQKPESLSLGSN